MRPGSIGRNGPRRSIGGRGVVGLGVTQWAWGKGTRPGTPECERMDQGRPWRWTITRTARPVSPGKPGEIGVRRAASHRRGAGAPDVFGWGQDQR